MLLAQKNDGELLRLYGEARSEQAFAELMRRYARLVYTTCLRETEQPTLAEDAAQAVFLLLSQKALALQRRRNLAGWLFLASQRVSKNVRRSEMRRQAVELRAMETLPPPREDTLWEQVGPGLRNALDRLKPAEREAILLRFPGERSLAEVGAAQGISENTARMRVSRALEKVRGHLAKSGVTISTAALAALWLERNSEALPVSLTGPSGGLAAAGTLVPTGGAALAARQAARQMASQSAARWATGVALLLAFSGAGLAYNVKMQWSLRERREFFATAAGAWEGSLEYADDGSGQRFTYPAAVQIESVTGTDGDTIQATATFTGSPVRDVTTFQFALQGQTCRVSNGGASASHRLNAVGAFTAVGANAFLFEGRDASRAATVRLRLTRQNNSLTIQEEYQRSGETKFRFRNRFRLTR